MEDVNGLRVILVKKPVIPHRISRFVSVLVTLKNSAKTAPMLAPALSEGANIPPAAPVEKEIIGPKILKIGKYHDTCLSSVKSVFTIISLPEPSVYLSKKEASEAIIRPQIETYRIL